MTRYTLALIALLAVAGSSALVLAQTTPPKADAAAAAQDKLETATFASGCFWCAESDFDKVDGVKETISGFMGGTTKNPTYEQVSMGHTGHAESVQLKFDPKVVSYKQLIDYYWHHTDVLDGGGQFCDRGNQYRPVIFVATPEQRKVAEESKAALEKSGRFKQPIAVQIADAGVFTPAEDYHQDFHNTHPLKYNYYRYACGRDARLKQLWGDEAASATH
jgi:peptide-methionine (S)-S-oxide reductase